MASFARKQRTRLLVSYVTAVLSHGLLAIQQLRDKNSYLITEPSFGICRCTHRESPKSIRLRMPCV